MATMYKKGEQVIHAYTKEPLWVLREGNEQILCRTRDLREVWFYPYELEKEKLSEGRFPSQRFL